MYPKLNPDVCLARNHLGLLTPSLYPLLLGLRVYVTMPSYLSLVLFETGYHPAVGWPDFVAKAGFNLLFPLPLPLEF